jgi:hypothetical protein
MANATEKTGPQDYCTLFPDRLGHKDWSNCCKAHDAAYAGTGARLAADRELAACVAAETGWDGLAVVMFAGVATFGWWFRRKGKSNTAAAGGPVRRV